MTTTGNTSTGTTNSYPSHKTISLVVEKPIVNTEVPPVGVKENNPSFEAKSTVNQPVKESYPTHKTINLGQDKAMVNTEVPPIVVKENIPAVETKLTVNQSVKESYPTHKTINLNEDKAVVNTETPPVIVKENKPVAEIKQVVKEEIKANYPAHKTISFGNEQPEIKKDETLKQGITGKLDSLSSNLKSDEVVQKATDIIKDQPVVQKIEDTVQKVSGFKIPSLTEKTEELIQKPADLVKDQLEIPKTDISTNTLDKIKEQPVIQKVDENIQKATSFVKGQPVIQKADAIINSDKPITTAINQLTGNTYPAHKTIVLDPAAAKQENVTPVIPAKEEVKTPVQEQVIIKENKEEPVATVKSTLPQGSYPEHKTHYFVREENANPAVQDVKTKVTPDSNESVSAQTKPAAVKTTPETIVQAKAKKPILWIAASATLLIASGATAWYAYQQKKTMQEEIVVLKQDNEALAENVKKLQKELHFDDIIARAGKLDAKNNITVNEDANASEIMRACFSITPNALAKKGKKLVYVRFLDAAGNVLVNGNKGEFQYKGNKVPYSVKEEIDYKGAEMMLCIDFKPADKLQKGTYKAEIYNEGVLDGTSTFELK